MFIFKKMVNKLFCEKGWEVMASALDRLSITGFKSIKELTNFELQPLNVLIGANGAGK
ncbi:MAG: hypothetical protein R2865_09085 [Deinococcales bacterium]